MMTSSPISLTVNSLDDKRFWWQHLTPYHWFVILVASMAWFFDCLDQRIFTLARIPALNALKEPGTTDASVAFLGKIVTACFLIGWGLGGMCFGALGDRFGRAKMLTVSILIYSMFTGLSFFSHWTWDFTLFRFLTGVGVGGVFGLAVALIAETVPTAARTQSLGLLQILSAVGNITASYVLKGVNALEAHHVIGAGQGWRYMFLIGAVPALMVIFTGWFLREPEPWLQLKRQGMLSKGNILSPYINLLSSRTWRKNLIIGALIASTGVVGLWAIGEYAADIQQTIFKAHFAAQGLVPAAVETQKKEAIANAFLLNQLGAVVGMWLFTRIALTWGRRLAFLIGFSSALVVTLFVYWKMSSPMDAYWMMPLMGMAQLSVFAGFSIYLPELFPSSMRSTGTSFCYNLGRFGAAGGSFVSGLLSLQFANAGFAAPLPARYSAMTMCAIFLVGLVTLIFAPETKGKALPEEEVQVEPPRGFPVMPLGAKQQV